MVSSPALKALALYALAQCAHASSILFQSGTIIGWSEKAKSLEVTRRASLLITDDRITAIYAEGEDPGAPKDAEIIDATGKIITPGFVDGHRHNWQVAWRTADSKLTLYDYFHRLFSLRVTAVFEPEDIYSSHLLGFYEGLNVGVTTMLDHAHHSWTKEHGEAGLRASLDSGARVVHAYNLGSIGYGITLEEQAAHLKELRKSYRDVLDRSTVSLGIASDVFAFEDEKALEPVLDLIREADISCLTTHFVGGPYGVDNTPEILHQLGILNTSVPVVFGHANFLDQRSYELLKATDRHACITIESEMSVGQTNPTAHQWLDQAALGIDSFFVFSGDLLTQAQFLLSYLRHLFFTAIVSHWEVPFNSPVNASEAFLLATRSGGPPVAGHWGHHAGGKDRCPGLGYCDLRISRMVLSTASSRSAGKLLANNLDEVKAKFLKTALRVHTDTPPMVAGEGETFFSGAKVAVLPQVDVIRGDGDGKDYVERVRGSNKSRGQATSHGELRFQPGVRHALKLRALLWERRRVAVSNIPCRSFSAQALYLRADYDQLGGNFASGTPATQWTFLFLTALTIAARLYLRIEIQNRRLRGSDLFMCAAWITGLVSAAIDVKWIMIDLLDPDVDMSMKGFVGTPEQVSLILKLSWISNIPYHVTFYLAKAALLAVYLQVFPEFMVKRRMFLWVTIIYVALSLAATILEVFLVCLPLSSNWDPSPNNMCAANSVALVFQIAWGLHLFGDLLIFILPWLIVGDLNLQGTIKKAVYCTFLLGVVNIAICVTRFALVQAPGRAATISFAQVAFWNSLDLYVALFIACLPSLRSYFRVHRSFSTEGSANVRNSRPTNSWKFDTGSSDTTQVDDMGEVESGKRQHSIVVDKTFSSVDLDAKQAEEASVHDDMKSVWI
ncbi:hypothetical protein ACJZ2D_014321 [Fusarium nematophilum]